MHAGCQSKGIRIEHGIKGIEAGHGLATTSVRRALSGRHAVLSGIESLVTDKALRIWPRSIRRFFGILIVDHVRVSIVFLFYSVGQWIIIDGTKHLGIPSCCICVSYGNVQGCTTPALDG